MPGGIRKDDRGNVEVGRDHRSLGGRGDPRRRGKDEIDATKGRAADRINCGPGKDELVLAKGSKSKVQSSCEKVKYR